ncbi:MAG: OmpA family protein [Planctomycetes bacterium]|nr:OmpA family protein [Planctomycetota bacterium]
MARLKKLKIGSAAAAAGEPDESAVRWLISYADFMMQLVCLFILLYSVSSLDVNKLKAIVEAWREQIGLEPVKVDRKSEGEKTPVTAVKPAEIAERVTLELGRVPDGRSLRVSPTADGFRVSVAAPMFVEGKDDLAPQGEKILDLVAWLLKPYEAHFTAVEIEGHGAAGETDGEGRLLLRLSLDRARAAARHLLRPEAPHPLAASRFVVSGRGASDPVADETRPEERPKNMRVDFRVEIRGLR